MSFYRDEWSGTDYDIIHFCCKVAELGSWGGDEDSYEVECTYEEAIESIKQKEKFLKECGYKIIVSTTNQDQPNAHKALKDSGFNCSTKKYLDETKTKYVRFYWKYL